MKTVDPSHPDYKFPFPNGETPAVEQVTMFRSRDGTMFTSEEAARNHNGAQALHKALVRDLDSKLSIVEVRQVIVAKLADWYVLWLEAQK